MKKEQVVKAGKIIFLIAFIIFLAIVTLCIYGIKSDLKSLQ